MKNFMKKGEKGFTLIELLIVIVILGVLAAAIIPNLSKFVSSGELGAANAELATVRTAISAYIADNQGDLPVDADGVTVTEASIIEYMSGTASLKAVYTCDAAGTVDGATAKADGWSAKITFNTTTLQWEKA
jgi:prepilin-type N-terminal cleavage/methylation domain-containing protein